jgi:hypothetical protein
MPRPKRESPFANEYLRELIAPALFAEVALHADGCWCANQLELKVSDSGVPAHRRRQSKRSTLACEQFEATSLLKQMLGSRVPTDDVLDELEQVFHGARLTDLKDHVLWKMMIEGEPGQAAAAKVMKGLSRPNRESLHLVINDRSPMQYFDRHCDRYGRLLSLGYVEALVMLTAALRHAQEYDLCNVDKVANALREVFPRIVSRAPQLFIRWRHLAMRYESIGKGMPLLSDECSDWTSLEEDVEAAARQARADGVGLPPDSMVKTPDKWRTFIIDKKAVWRFALAAGLLG